MIVKSLFQLLRPKQWAKNLFIFLPLFFSGQFFNVSLLIQCAIAFIAFSFAASSIYCFNDIFDVESDRQHPKKVNRPIASGRISIQIAYIVMFISLFISLLILFLFGSANKFMLLGLILFYYLTNIAYCIKLKRHAIVDVMIISLGFVLRILVGGAATGIWLSEWIIMMTFLLALFLALAKRRDDVILYQNTGVLPRKNTDRYNLVFINQVMSIVATVTIIAYIMYAISPDVIERFQSRYVYVTAIFVLAGIIRYLQITIVDMRSGDPTAILLKDRFLQLSIIGWVISFLIIIYL